MRFVYNLIITLISPVFFLKLLYRSKQAPAYRQRWNERLGFYWTGTRKDGVIWFHAVSFGEAEAVFPLMKMLKQLYPELPQLMTTTTLTGSERVRSVFGDSIMHMYLPYDLPGAASRFLRHFQPVLGVVVETEIWPNLYRDCEKMKIPLVIINARLSERSVRGYKKIPGLVRETLGHVSLIAAQSNDDAKKFLEIGAEQKKVFMTGNIKFDYPVPDRLRETGYGLRAKLFGPRPVWIAASTHHGEEEQILESFESVRAKCKDALLILVPRHPERFDPVIRICARKGFSVIRRSAGLSCPAETSIFLLDSMGELKQFYATADLAFIGGSLVKCGGHNVLEAAVLGVPVIFGPYMDNFRIIADSLLKAGGAVQIDNSLNLGLQVIELLSDERRRHSIGNCGRLFVEENRGALNNILELLRVHLDESLKRSQKIDFRLRESA